MVKSYFPRGKKGEEVKIKYKYLGKVDTIHIFEEVPSGSIKNPDDFEAYYDYCHSNSSFKRDALNKDEFVHARLCSKQLEAVEKKEDHKED